MRKTNDLKWLAKACDRTHAQSCCHYPFQDTDCAWATDRHRMHFAWSTELPRGAHKPDGTLLDSPIYRKGLPRSPMTLLPPVTEARPLSRIAVGACERLPLPNAHPAKGSAILLEGVWVSEKYFEDAISGMADPVLSLAPDRLRIDCGTGSRTAVVMRIRLTGEHTNAKA